MKYITVFVFVLMLALSGCAPKIETDSPAPVEKEPTATSELPNSPDITYTNEGIISSEQPIEPTWSYPSSDNWQMIGQIGGTTKALFRDGNLLYLGSGLHVLVLDVAESKNIHIVGTSPMLPQFIESISGDGKGHLFVSCGSGGLVILNVSNPPIPTISAYLDTLGYTENAISFGQYVVLADGPRGVQIVDISDIQEPVIVSEAYSLAYVYDIAIKKDTVYAAGGGSGLFTIDMSDPEKPVEAGLIPVNGCQYDAEIIGGRLYLAGAWGGVSVFDIYEPLSPALTSSIETPGWAMALSSDNTNLLVLDGADGALLFDIAGVRPEKISAVSLGGFMMTGALYGASAFVTDEELGLIALDYTKKTDPGIISRWMPLLDGRRVCMNGTTCYVAGGLSGIHTYDMTKLDNPLELASCNLDGDYVNKVIVDGTTMYSASSGKVQMAAFDVNDPSMIKKLSQPLQTDAVDTSVGTAFRSMAVGNGYAFIAGEHADLSIDISDPHNLKLVSWIPAENVNGDYRGNLFVSTSNMQLHIVDVSDPENIQLAAVLDKHSRGEAVRFINDTVLLTSADPGIWIVDVSNPSKPRKIAQLAVPGVVMEACIDGQTAYLSCLGDGIQIVDLSDLMKPALIGQIETLGSAFDCCISENTLVVADSYAGLCVYTRPGTQTPTSVGMMANIPLSLRTGDKPYAYELALVKPEAPTETYSVVITSVADSGTGTLREALDNLNTNTTITFDPVAFPADHPTVIQLESPLPEIVADYVTIDASNAGVILDGGNLEHGCGLVLYSSNDRVMGLQILNFPQHGIDLEGNNSVVGGSRETGTGPLGQGNLLSGNGQYGIYVYGSYHSLLGNFVGVDVTGSTSLSNFSVFL